MIESRPPDDPALKIWTWREKLVGNWPAFLALPAITVTIFGVLRGNNLATLLGGGIAFGLLAFLAKIGLWKNDELAAKLSAAIGNIPENARFVGVAPIRQSNLFELILDEHFAIGFLWMDDDQLCLETNRDRLWIRRDEILAIRKIPNAHSIAGLGFWINVRSTNAKFSIESRISRSMLMNKKATKQLVVELEQWLRNESNAGEK